VFDRFEQRTPPWFFLHMGIPTSSNFKIVLAKGRGGSESVQRDRLRRQCAHELMTQIPTETYKNQYMERGNEQEAEAFEAYLAVQGINYDIVQRPAFLRREDLWAGCSPDALIGEDGGVEVKTLIGHDMVGLLENPDVPKEHIPQIMGNLLVSGRKWWDICVYSRGHDPFVRRVLPDREYMTNLQFQLKAFNAEVEATCLKLRGETARTFRNRLDQRFAEIEVEWLRSIEGFTGIETGLGDSDNESANGDAQGGRSPETGWQRELGDNGPAAEGPGGGGDGSPATEPGASG